MNRIFVLIADGQSLFSEALASAIDDFPELISLEDRPTSSEATLEAISGHRPDVALVDYWIPGAWPPVGLLERAQKASPHSKVLFTSWLYSRSEIESVLEAGAVGFLPKSLKVADVVKGVRTAYAGVSPVLGDQLKDLTDKIRSREEGAGRATNRLEDLSPRELGILIFLASGLSTKEMAERLSLSPATTRTHMGRLLKKTGCTSQVELVALARNYGFVQM